jgi:hypothetical protein
MSVSHWRRVVEEDVDVDSGDASSSELETIQLLDVECRKAAVFLVVVDDIDGATHAEDSCPNVASHARINTLLVFIIVLLVLDIRYSIGYWIGELECEESD